MAAVARDLRQLAAEAQQASPVIGLLHEGLPPPLSLTTAFQQGLIEGGISRGTSVRAENRWAEGQYDLLPGFAAELVDKRVGIIVAVYLVAARAAKAATRTTPVVFITGSDPVGADLVPSLNRPKSNLTGRGPLAASRCQSAGRSRTSGKQGAIHERGYNGRLTNGQRLHGAKADITKPRDRSRFDPSATLASIPCCSSEAGFSSV